MQSSMGAGMGGDSAGNSGSAALSGSWSHSYEEDQGDVEVYRPSATFAFPPSRRGRETLVFGPDGRASMGMPGPDDRQQHATITVTPVDSNRFRFEGGAFSSQMVEVLELSPTVLRLRRTG